MEWKYKAVKTQNSNIMKEWYDSLPPKGQAKVDTILRYLKNTPRWKRPYAANLTGYNKIIEIRITCNNILYRPLGCFGPGVGIFTFLFIAEERGNKFEPKDAPNIAEDRCNKIHNGLIAIEDYE